MNQSERESLKLNLKFLTKLIEKEKYIIGEKISIAVIAVAAQLSLLSFPKSSGEKLKEKVCDLYSKDPSFQILFNWRYSIENELI